MKYLCIAFIALAIISCGTKSTKHIKAVNDTGKLDTAKSAIQTATPDKHSISLLKSKQIISNDYPDTALVLLNSRNLDEGNVLSAIQFQYDSSLQNLYESELVFNVLLLHCNDQIINYHVIDAVEEEDFNFLFSSEQYIIYEFYSSPVGYTIYYILNTKNKHLFKSEAIEEGYVIDTSKINFEHKKLITSFYDKFKAYSLKKVW